MSNFTGQNFALDSAVVKTPKLLARMEAQENKYFCVCLS